METNDLDGFMAQMRGPRSHKQESTTSLPAIAQDACVLQSAKASAGGDDVVDGLRRGRRFTFAVSSKPYSGLTAVGRSQVDKNQQMTASIFGAGITQPTLQSQSQFQTGITSASSHAISQLRALPQTPLQSLPDSYLKSQPQLPSSAVSVSSHAMGQLRGLPQNSLQNLPQSQFQDTFQYSTFPSIGLNSVYNANFGAFGDIVQDKRGGTFGFHGCGAAHGSPYVPDSQINDETVEDRLVYRFRSPDLPYPNTYGGPLEIVPIPTALLMNKKASLAISQSIHPTDTVLFHPERQRMLEEDCEQDVHVDEYGEDMSQQRYYKKRSEDNSNLIPLGSRAKIPTVAGPSRLNPPSDPPFYPIGVFGSSSTGHGTTSAGQAFNAIMPPSRENHESNNTTSAPTLPESDLDSEGNDPKAGIIHHHSDNASIHDIAEKQIYGSDLAGAPQSRRIRVGNLHRKTTKENMINLFRGYQVESVFFPSDPLYRGILKYCLVDLVTGAEAQHALTQLKEIQLHERYLSVRMPHQPTMNNGSLSVGRLCRRHSPPHGGLGTNSATDMSAPAFSCTASLEPLNEGGDKPLDKVGDRSESLNASYGGSYSGPEQAGQEESMEASSAPFFACCSAMEAPSQDLYPGTFTIIKTCWEENDGTRKLMSKPEIVDLEFFPALGGPNCPKRAEQRDFAKVLVMNEHGEVVEDVWWTNIGLGKCESSGWHKLQAWDRTIFHERFVRADFHFCCKVHRMCFEVISLEKAHFFVQSKGETVLKKQKKSTLRHNGIGRLVDPLKVNSVAKRMMAMKQQHDQRLSKMDSRKSQMISKELAKVAGQGQLKVEEQTQNKQATCEGPTMEKTQDSQEAMLMCVDPSTGGNQTMEPAKPLWMEIGDILDYAS